MAGSLFVERFLVSVEPDEKDGLPEASYDERRRYNVTPDGRPYVELDIVGSTVTITRVAAEPDDDDREWNRAVGSIDTLTKAQSDTDRWSL